MAAGTSGEGLFAALKHLVTTLVGIGRTRLELLATEVEEEKHRLVGLVANALAALYFVGLGIVVAIAFLAAAFWEQRLLVFGLAALLLLGVGTVFAALALAAAKRGSPLFRASLAELDADLTRLKGRPGGKG